MDGLGDRGLRGEEVDGQSLAEHELLEGFACRRRRGVVGLDAATFEGLGHLEHLLVAREGRVRGEEAGGEE